MEIEKNIPIPPRSKYPIDKMEVGDSISIPGVGNISDVIRKFKEMGWKFTSRKEDDHYRLWRTK